MSFEDLFDRKERHILFEILEELKGIRRQLEPKFVLHINQFPKRRHHMIAGQDATFFLTATASDGSIPVIANPILTADDSNVTVVTDTTDPTGLSFVVTVSASDTNTSFNLNAKADITSSTSPASQQVSASLPVTIQPATVPVSFTLTINEK